MLPAISAALPAYLVPPSNKEAGRQTTTDAGSGPSAKVELSAGKAAEAQSGQPGNGLYGADGRFVESAARRGDAAPQTPHGAERPASSPTASAPESSGGMLSGSDVPSTAGSRDLSIDSFNSALPPAATEELRSLADRVERKAAERELSSRDYRQVAELMERVGRHDEAKRAADAARAAEQPRESMDDAEDERVVAEARAAERAAEARDAERAEALTYAETAGVE